MKKNNQYYLFAKEDIYDEYHKNVLYLKDELIGNVSILKQTADIHQVLPKGLYYLQKKGEMSYPQDIWIEEKLESWKYFENVLMLKQVISIDLKVIDQLTKEIISGVHCGIFAKEDIYDQDGKLLYRQDDLIADLKSEEDEIYRVPLLNVNKGTFYIQQIDVVEGYFGNVEQFEMKVNFDLRLISFSVVIENQPTAVEISKYNEQGDFLKGAWLAVYDENDELVDEWMSEKEHMIYGLVIQHQYIIKEFEAPEGYQEMPDYCFVIANMREVQKIKLVNSLKGGVRNDKTMC